MRFVLYACLCALLILYTVFHAPAARAEQGEPRYRALLVACDTFVYASEITPAGRNNLQMMDFVLAQDVRGFEIRHQYGITSSAEMLEYAITAAFGDAKEGDVSLLYIATHGEFDPTVNNPEGALILSDGSLEDHVTAQQLNAYLDKIKGTKVLLVDACNAGALIGKGISPSAGPSRVARMFLTDDYKVLTSSGASEPSWFWRETVETAPPGSSYFTTALALGAGYLGGFAADANRDGTITLAEMYNYLWGNQASSTVQMFPQEDEFPLFVYDRALLASEDAKGELSGFTFGSLALDPSHPVLSFGYTVKKPTRVHYQITPLKDGVWDWRNTVTLPELSEFDGDADPLGDVTPGRKAVSLGLSDILPRDWTYAMVHIITQGKRGEDRGPFVYASRVLSAKRQKGDPQLSVRAPSTWQRQYRKELEIFVAHAFPLNLSVAVFDAQGDVVRRLWVYKATKPQALLPEGSQLYWSGRDTKGEPVPPGTYRIVASARVGGQQYDAEAFVTVE